MSDSVTLLLREKVAQSQQCTRPSFPPTLIIADGLGTRLDLSLNRRIVFKLEIHQCMIVAVAFCHEYV